MALLEQLEEAKLGLQNNPGELDLNLALEVFDNEMRKYSLGWDYGQGDPRPYDYNKEIFTNRCNIPYPKGHERRNDTPCVFTHYPTIQHSVRHDTAIAGVVAEGSDDIAILPIRFRYSMEAGNSSHFYNAIRFAYNRGSRIAMLGFVWHREDKSARALCQAIKSHPDMAFYCSSGKR